MPAFLFKLETAEDKPADPRKFSTVVYNWRAGDTIPLGGRRSLLVVDVRDEDADAPPVLVVEETMA